MYKVWGWGLDLKNFQPPLATYFNKFTPPPHNIFHPSHHTHMYCDAMFCSAPLQGIIILLWPPPQHIFKSFQVSPPPPSLFNGIALTMTDPFSRQGKTWSSSDWSPQWCNTSCTTAWCLSESFHLKGSKLQHGVQQRQHRYSIFAFTNNTNV